jgi:hypothetical protein
MSWCSVSDSFCPAQRFLPAGRSSDKPISDSGIGPGSETDADRAENDEQKVPRLFGILDWAAIERHFANHGYQHAKQQEHGPYCWKHDKINHGPDARKCVLIHG